MSFVKLLISDDNDFMITFENLWKVMKEKNITKYALINRYGISPGTITRLRRNEGISTYMLNLLCNILDCEPSDIMDYTPDKLHPVMLEDREVLFPESHLAESSKNSDCPSAHDKPDAKSFEKETVLSQNLFAFLKEKNISPKELSRLSEISLCTIRNIQYNKTKNPRIETLSSIANALNVSIEDLVTPH